jgi:hypothetical protein
MREHKLMYTDLDAHLLDSLVRINPPGYVPQWGVAADMRDKKPYVIRRKRVSTT